MLTPEVSHTPSPTDTTWILNGTDDRYEILFGRYKGVDFSKQAYLFCGQGAMSPGVGNEGLEGHPVFQRRFKELDELAAKWGAGTPSDYVRGLNQPYSPETEAVYSGLCLFTVQMAMFEAILGSGRAPMALSAHSFGEFAQLVASGVMTFPDMVRFLIDRQSCLAEFKDQYTLFAVSHSAPVNLAELPFDIFPANFNTAYQTVFACRAADFAGVKAALREKRLACVKMNIDYPYHTPWMEPVRKRLAQVMSDRPFTFRAPVVPFVSSVTHDTVTAQSFSPELIQKILLDQLVTPVHFPVQLQRLHEMGIAHFIELSPVDVLDAFVEQFFETGRGQFKVGSFRKNFKAASTANKSYERLKDSKFFGKLDSALKALTGYSAQSIRLEDRIREDLGIDSIKKAEIVFEIVDSMSEDSLVTPANLADLATFGDVLEYFEMSKVAAQTFEKRAVDEEAKFVPGRRDWRPCALNDYTSIPASPCRRLKWADVRAEREDLDALVSELLVLDARGVQVDDYLAEMKWWLGALRQSDQFGRGFILLHDGSPAAEGLSAILTSLSQERQFAFKSIYVDSGMELSDSLLNQERADFCQVKVRYSGGQRQIRHYDVQEAPQAKAYRRVLVFGGMGGVGRNLIQSFPAGSLEKAVVVGRTPKDKVSGATLEEFKKIAAEVEYVGADVTAHVGGFDSLVKSHGPFDLIIHAVGVEVSEPLDKISDENIDQILTAKIRLGESLSAYAKANPQVKVVFNSSVVSDFGSRGQCPYAAANARLNTMAEASSNIISILWPGWDGIGVAAQDINAKSLKLQGLTLMSAKVGQAVFQESLGFASGTIPVIGRTAALDFSSIGQNRHEFSWLMKPASRDYSLFVVPGLTQARMPYLKDHLVKRACIFPASGSMAMMLFRGYIERGELGHIEQFEAHNFLVVRENTSNVTLETTGKSENEMAFQLKSHQVLATGHVRFGARKAAQREYHFHCDKTGFTDFDQNLAVYTGPNFQLTNQSFMSGDSLLLELDLEKAPVYVPIEIIDKVHRLIEFSFNTSFAKGLHQFKKFSVPKSVGTIEFYGDDFKGHKFYSLMDNFRQEGDLYVCDIVVLNEHGHAAMGVKNMRSIIVGDSQTTKTDGFTIRDLDRKFF